MTNSKYAGVPPVPSGSIPLARAWSMEEFIKTCSIRATLDALLPEIDPREFDVDSIEAIVRIGPKLPCFAMELGTHLYLETTYGGSILPVPGESGQRQRLHRQLQLACSDDSAVPLLPTNAGLYDLVNGRWERCWSFRKRRPCALVMDSELLDEPLRWMICEAHERAHAVGLEDAAAVEFEILVARALLDQYRETDRGPKAMALLEESIERQRARG